MRAEVGDDIRIVFKNKAPRGFSIDAPGLSSKVAAPTGSTRRRLLSGSDTSVLEIGDPSKQAIEANGTFVYNWQVEDWAGPGPVGPSSLLWTYISAVDPSYDLYSGLAGGVIVTRKGVADASRVPKDIDREVIAFFGKYGEDESHLVQKNLAELTPNCLDECHWSNNTIHKAMYRRSLNGYMYDNNVQNIEMVVGERVRFYVAALGEKVNVTAYWHGPTMVTHEGKRTQAVTITPKSIAVADMVPEVPGRYFFEIKEHAKNGMVGSFLVKAKS